MLLRGTVLTVGDRSGDEGRPNAVHSRDLLSRPGRGSDGRHVEENAVAWVNDEQPSEESGDIPTSLAGANLSKVMKEVHLAGSSGAVPIQRMWSNAVIAPAGRKTPPLPSALPCRMHNDHDYPMWAFCSRGTSNVVRTVPCPHRPTVIRAWTRGGTVSPCRRTPAAGGVHGDLAPASATLRWLECEGRWLRTLR
jgi:hypothetical protein